MRDWALTDGRNFTEAELRAGAKVVILGATTARELFGSASALGEQIRISNVPFSVIGLLSVKGQSGWGSDQDDTALVPITTARRRLFGAEQTIPDNLRTIMVEIASAEGMADAQAEIETLLRERRRIREGAPDDFRVRDMADFIRTRTETQSILSLLLGATAAISLVVGGIGIMNIMLVSVTERTREIGLRMAVGARRRDIFSQFLIEAVTLCVVGGSDRACDRRRRRAGHVDLGELADRALARAGPGRARSRRGWSASFFGYYPARRASLMNPIDALRYE